MGNRLEKFICFYIVFAALCHNINIVSKERVVLITVILMLIYLPIRLIFSMSSTTRVRISVYKIDILWIVWLVYVLIHRASTYSIYQTVFLVASMALMYLLRSNLKIYKSVFCAIILYSVMNVVANIISGISPSLFRKVLSIFKVTSWELYTNGQFIGLTNGISRNALLCVIGISVFFSLAIVCKKFFYWICSGILIVIVLMTGKVGHTVFLFCTLFITYSIVGSNMSQKLKRVLFILITMSIAMVILYEVFPQIGNSILRFQLKADRGDITNGRLALWRYAIDCFRRSPIFGIGYGAFTTESIGWSGIVYAGVHNDYIQLLCETGIVGIVMYGILVISTLSFSIRCLRNEFLNENSVEGKILIVWSVFIQVFIILYSLTGLPHFSCESNVVLYAAYAVPYAIKEKNSIENSGKKILI